MTEEIVQHGFFPVGVGITYNPQYREGINKDRLSALRAQYPEIYDEFVDQTELRIFKVVKTAIA